MSIRMKTISTLIQPKNKNLLRRFRQATIPQNAKNSVAIKMNRPYNSQ